MSGFHNNANWIAHNIIQYERFNSSYKFIYFTPTGKVLECYSWKDESPVSEEARKNAQIEALEIVDQMQVMPLGRTLTGKHCDNPSPSIRINGYEYNLQQSMAMYFMEHGGDCSELNNKIKVKYPSTKEDHIKALQFIQGELVDGKIFSFKLWELVHLNKQL